MIIRCLQFIWLRPKYLNSDQSNVLRYLVVLFLCTVSQSNLFQWMGTGRPAETQNHSRSVSLLNIGAPSIFANTRLERKEEVSGLFMDARTKKKKKMSLLGNIFVVFSLLFLFQLLHSWKELSRCKGEWKHGWKGVKREQIAVEMGGRERHFNRDFCEEWS